MKLRKVAAAVLAAMILSTIFSATPVEAKGREYELIVKHLKTRYKAKKIKIPFMWLARAAVKVVRPAGVQSFSVTVFEGLKFSRETLDREMQEAMRISLGDAWDPILRVRTRAREQVYMYMREAGDNVRIILVTIDNDEAVVVRASFSPERLVDFLEDPRIFGVAVGENDRTKRVPTLSTKN